MLCMGAVQNGNWRRGVCGHIEEVRFEKKYQWKPDRDLGVTHPTLMGLEKFP